MRVARIQLKGGRILDMAAPSSTDKQPLLPSTEPNNILPKTDMSREQVMQELNLDINKTAGSRHHNARPLAREEMQLRQEGAFDKRTTEEVRNEEHKERKHSLSDMLAHPSHIPHPHLVHDPRASIANSSPLTVVRDPKSGDYITAPNPHWPEEDSWKRENVRSGRGDDSTIAPGGVGGVSYF
ncbi:hypothetical protein BAUCODRAFT_475611 [Baudoinia panamericana UAMH 10762]|uniref:Uncharacterized protein n=1 Tax=Baudoinia panamericana (strain UAMH 10762) TaxID=717646 RepID=M2MY11_BAUPA|nr:uncharacterized protein BAUCODRAFT_475611 [Baudoinia panamericana UAMH 10762]EMC96458.1 hypothetical protein BAUCODRAFT_475611 [Baudoinia panamericana UAMH 10762]